MEKHMSTVHKAFLEPTSSYIKRVLNSKSKSFCGAKWYNATIWLGQGVNSSCHHPPPHPIDQNEIKTNYKAIHNTKYKKLVRKQMLEGIRPSECEYCWKIEDNNINNISDRFHKSAVYTEKELRDITKLKWNEDVDLLTLEIAFDNNCNFACSYCNPTCSTTWSKDIKTHGAYDSLQGADDVGLTFAQTGEWALPHGSKNENNPYVEAFWKWWDADLCTTLKELRVTGGEPTVSNNFWKLLDWWKEHKECQVILAINSNLGFKFDICDKLVKASHYINTCHIYTSNESYGKHAEYIRDGLVWDLWTDNLNIIAKHSRIKLIHIMFTINALCLASITKLIEYIFTFQETYKDIKIDMSFNILRWPSFQSITTLPKYLVEQKIKELEEFIEHNSQPPYFKEGLKSHQVDRLTTLINYLKNEVEGFDGATDLTKRQQNFKAFYTQYDQRRNKSFIDTFADWPELVKWYNSLDYEFVPQEQTSGVQPKNDHYERVLKENKEQVLLLMEESM